MALSSPTLQESFDGPSFDADAALNGGSSFIPPDPAGAVGQQSIVVTTNGAIEWFGRDGTLQHSQSLDSLFSAGGAVSGAFDPKVVYDAAADRFVVAATNGLEMFIAVSKTGNPGDGWIVGAASATLGADIGGQLDYTSLATDGRSIFVTANVFDADGAAELGSQLFVWQGALGATTTLGVAAILDPSVDSALAASAELDTLQPAKMIGTPPGVTGTFLVSLSGAKDAAGHSLLSIVRVDDPTTAVPSDATRQVIDVGAIDGGNGAELTAGQLGGTAIDAGDGRITDAVWANGFLYAVATVVSQRAGNVGVPEVHWFKFDTSDPANITLVDQGEVDGSAIAPGTATFDGSIAVDSRGSFVVNFAASGPGIHPGAYYAMHMAGEAAGTLETPQALAAGQDSYLRTFGQGDNRWGDFSSAVVDPSDPRAFWLVNEYAQPSGTPDSSGETGRWGTRVGEVLDDHVPVVANLAPHVHAGQQVAAASLFQTSDADSDAITQYELWDPAAGNGGFTVNGVAQAARQVIPLTSLAGLGWDTTGQNGTAVASLRAFDGVGWSSWTTVSIAATERPPTIAASNPSVHGAQQLAPASLFQATDPDGDAITQYELWDPVLGNGGFSVGGAAQAARQVINVPAASLATLAWDTTGESGRAVFSIRASDGTLWSDWTTATVNLADAPPAVAPLNPSVHGAQQIAAASLFGVTDPDSDPVTEYQLWDPAAGNGGFTINGQAQAARQVLDLSSLAGLAWDTTGQSGSTVFAMRASDGSLWSDWTTVTVTAADAPPTVAALGTSVAAGQSVAAASLFQIADPDGDPITGYQLWDPLAGNGGFTINGQAQTARQVLDVSSLAGLAWDTTGQTGSTVFAARAFDGSLWSDWTTVTVGANASVHQAPVSSAASQLVQALAGTASSGAAGAGSVATIDPVQQPVLAAATHA